MNRLNHIEQIYDRHSQGLYATSLRIVGNSMDAEEIMQDTNIKYHHYPHKEEIENLPGWLKSVCIRKSLDKLREKHRTREMVSRAYMIRILPPEENRPQSREASVNPLRFWDTSG